MNDRPDPDTADPAADIITRGAAVEATDQQPASAPAEQVTVAPRDTAAATPRSAAPLSVTPPRTAGPAGLKRRTWIVLGVLATGLLLLGVILLLLGVISLAALGNSRRPGQDVAATGLGAPVPSTYAAAPTLEVQRIRTALHDMGARCKPGADTATQARIFRDVNQLISFTRRYPDSRFTIDGENGRPLDLLLIARDEMRTCAPSAAAAANQALPSQFRTASAARRIPASTGTVPGR